MKIRSASDNDLPEILVIFNYYIANTHATFDTEPQTTEQQKKWYETFGTSGPYRLLVAELDGLILGFGSSNPYRFHPAFKETVEFSIYCKNDVRGKGVGSALYSALFEIMKKEDVHLVVAGIAQPNPASVALHKKFGFRKVGKFTEYAKKNDHYISSLWFEKKFNLGHE